MGMMGKGDSQTAIGQPGKKRRKWPYILAVLLIIPIVIIGLLGLLPGLNGPRDLGVKYTRADYNRALKKSKLKLDNKPDDSPPDSHMVYYGQNPIDETFTNAEITALVNLDRSPRFKWSNVQIRFNSDGSAEGSGILKFRGMSFPVYAKGKGAIVGNKSISLSVQDIKVANFPISERLKEQGIAFVTDQANEKIQSIPGLELGDLKISGGKARFAGSIPEKAVREKE